MLTIHVWPKRLKEFLLTHPLYKSPLRFDQRETIARVYNANLRLPPARRKSQNQLAKELGLAKSTFSRQINRGRCDSPTVFAGRTLWEYSEHGKLKFPLGKTGFLPRRILICPRQNRYSPRANSKSS